MRKTCSSMDLCIRYKVLGMACSNHRKGIDQVCIQDKSLSVDRRYRSQPQSKLYTNLLREFQILQDGSQSYITSNNQVHRSSYISS